MSDKVQAAPTIEELRRVYDEGITQRLISGIEVQMHPIQIEKLLEAGDIPDTLTSILVKGLYEDVREDLDNFVMEKQDDRAKAVETIRSVDAVCRAVLIDPTIVPYLSLSDRFWLFKLAFMPAEVLSRFRLQSEGNVDVVDESQNVQQATE